MTPKNVLYVDFYSFVGGGQVNLLSLFKGINRKRYRPLLALPSEGPFAERARALGVPVFILPMGKARWRRFWEAVPAFFRLRNLMRQQRIVLVHANCYPANKLAGPAANSLGLSCLWHKQIAVTQKPGSSTGWLWKFFSRYNARVLAVSRQGFEGLKALGIPESKLRLLYNNADTRRFSGARPLSASAKKKFGLPAGRPLVLAAGGRRAHKGFDVFLKAAALVRGKAHFALLGDATPSEPAHEALLEKLASELKLQGRLTVLPAQPDLASWLKSASVFVSPSRWEGSSLVVIEAMASGAAIVATAQGSGELLKDGVTGWLCQAEDARGLARQIEAALKSAPERAKLGRKALAEASRRFSLKAYVGDLMALYDQL
jgi:glycosyltransferase involved in cell wall biosynthesis